MEYGVFHQVAKFVKILVVRALDFTMLSGRNDRLHSLAAGLGYDGVRIVATIRHQASSLHAGDQRTSVRAISGGTFRNNNSERHTMRIHGQMYLCVEPPFVRPMAWLPPRAPVACG